MRAMVHLRDKQARQVHTGSRTPQVPLSNKFVSLSHFLHVFFAYVVFDLVSSVLNQRIGWEECLQNDLFCV